MLPTNARVRLHYFTKLNWQKMQMPCSIAESYFHAKNAKKCFMLNTDDGILHVYNDQIISLDSQGLTPMGICNGNDRDSIILLFGGRQAEQREPLSDVSIISRIRTIVSDYDRVARDQFTKNRNIDMTIHYGQQVHGMVMIHLPVEPKLVMTLFELVLPQYGQIVDVRALIREHLINYCSNIAPLLGHDTDSVVLFTVTEEENEDEVMLSSALEFDVDGYIRLNQMHLMPKLLFNYVYVRTLDNLNIRFLNPTEVMDTTRPIDAAYWLSELRDCLFYILTRITLEERGWSNGEDLAVYKFEKIHIRDKAICTLQTHLQEKSTELVQCQSRSVGKCPFVHNDPYCFHLFERGSKRDDAGSKKTDGKDMGITYDKLCVHMLELYQDMLDTSVYHMFGFECQFSKHVRHILGESLSDEKVQHIVRLIHLRLEEFTGKRNSKTHRICLPVIAIKQNPDSFRSYLESIFI